jgi:type IV pilus assembly protein PilB
VRKKIGECLIQAGLITEEDLQIALAEHRRTGDRIGAVLVRLNFATEKQITKALAYQLGFPYASLADDPPDPAAIVHIPRDVALERGCVAVRLEQNLLTVAMSDPLLFTLVQDLEFQTGYRIKQVVATRTDILEAVENGYPNKALSRLQSAGTPSGFSAHARPCSGGSEAGDSTPIIDLADLVVNSGITSGASDIHIEPMEKGVLVRHRLDGLLKEVMDLPKWVHEGLVARLKLMAEMDITENRLPQAGRLRAKTEEGNDVDFRVSTLQTLYGEKIVLRVLDHRKGAQPLEELGPSVAAMVTAVEELLRVITEAKGMRTLCSGCGSAVAIDFMGCPHCGHKLNAGCGTCGRALQPGWNFCPFCNTQALPAKTAKKNVAPFKTHQGR